MSDDFDATPYVRPPVIDVAGGVGLGCALLAAMPHGAPTDVRKAARKLRATVVALQDAWAASDANTSTEDKRPADVAVDNAWSALEARLEAHAALPAARYPLAARAGELHALLFPEGLGFLKLPYAQEWAESEKRLRRIDGEHLAADLDRVAGPEFLAEVRRTHADYGKALGTTQRHDAPEPVNLADPLNALRRAMSGYTLRVAAMADTQDTDTLRAVRAALHPLDEHRANAARRAASGADAPPTATPTTPVPEVPEADKKH